MINYSFPYFGPLIYHVNLKPEEINKVKKICIKSKNRDARKGLAGVIEEEFYIDFKDYQKIILPYIEGFSHAYKKWYNKEIKPLKCNSAWVNYMKAGEYNPPHRHMNCQFSSVLYTDLPKDLEKENKKYIGTSGGPGNIIFNYGEPRDYNLTTFDLLPKVGDMFIFPHNLIHYATPFKSKGSRVSVAANFI